MLCLVHCLQLYPSATLPNKYHIHEIQTDSGWFERGFLAHKLTHYSLDRYWQGISAPHTFSDSKSMHYMCITAYSNTYLKMTSEETFTENSELVIKSGWTGYSPETFNETLGALHHAIFLGSCL